MLWTISYGILKKSWKAGLILFAILFVVHFGIFWTKTIFDSNPTSCQYILEGEAKIEFTQTDNLTKKIIDSYISDLIAAPMGTSEVLAMKEILSNLGKKPVELVYYYHIAPRINYMSAEVISELWLGFPLEVTNNEMTDVSTENIRAFLYEYEIIEPDEIGKLPEEKTLFTAPVKSGFINLKTKKSIFSKKISIEEILFDFTFIDSEGYIRTVRSITPFKASCPSAPLLFS